MISKTKGTAVESKTLSCTNLLNLCNFSLNNTSVLVTLDIFTLPIFFFENERLTDVTLADIAIAGLNSLSEISAI